MAAPSNASTMENLRSMKVLSAAGMYRWNGSYNQRSTSTSPRK